MINLTFSSEAGTTSSRKVARVTGFRHDNLMSRIKGYRETLDYLNLNTEEFFIESTYVNSKDAEQPCYIITSKGCEMVASIMVNQLSKALSGITVSQKDIEKEIAITVEKRGNL